MTTKECDCPPYVLRCVHVEGVTLIDRTLLPPDVIHQWIRADDLRYYLSGVGEFATLPEATRAFDDLEKTWRELRHA